MAKEIRIELDEQLSIKVTVGDILKKEIKKENREINALEIYETLDFDYETNYELIPIQEQGTTNDAVYDVLKTFYDLYQDIINEVNEIIAKKTVEISEQGKPLEEDVEIL